MLLLPHQLPSVVVVVVAMASAAGLLYARRSRRKNSATPRKKVACAEWKRTFCGSSGLWEVNSMGFLPRRAPLLRPMDPDLSILASLCEQLPYRVAEKSVAEFVADNARDFERASEALVVGEKSEDELECCHSCYSYIVCAFALESKTIPECLSRGFLSCCRLLDRKPYLDYSGCVLYNWELIDPRAGIHIHNVRMLRRLTGLPDEEWFFKTHLVIEADSAPAVRAIAASSGDQLDLSSVLATVEEHFGYVSRVSLPLMFEHDPKGVPRCDYSLFFHVLRPMISGDELVFEPSDKPTSLPGPSGAMSTLLPAIDTFLGVRNSNKKLADLLVKFRDSMPESHRRFLGSVRSVRDRVVESKQAGLIDCFDRCVDLLLDFRWRHLHMVKKYVIDQSPPGQAVRGTGGGSKALEYLHQHIADTEAARINTFSSLQKSTSATLKLACSEKWTRGGERGVRRLSSVSPSAVEVWIVDGDHGFCPSLTAAPRENDDLTRLCRAIPLGAATVRTLFGSMDLSKFRLALDDQALLETQRVQLAFVCAAYSRCDDETNSRPVGGSVSLPDSLASLLETASKALNRSKKLSFTDLVTYNAHCQRQIARFLAVQDEDRLYADLHKPERESPALVEAILDAEDSLRDLDALCSSLDRFRNALKKLSPAEDEISSLKTRKAVMRRLRKFLVPSGSDSDLATLLYCGSDASALLVTLWRFLGISRAASPASPLQFARDSLPKSRASPTQHKQFALERSPTKLRNAVLDLASQHHAVHTLARLEASYNGALDDFLTFCQKKAELVCSYLPHYGSDFMLKDFDPDVKAIRSARLHLLFDRRRLTSSSAKKNDKRREYNKVPRPPSSQTQLSQGQQKARLCNVLAATTQDNDVGIISRPKHILTPASSSEEEASSSLSKTGAGTLATEKRDSGRREDIRKIGQDAKDAASLGAPQ